MKKFKLFYNFDSEEQFLSDMSQKGYRLKKAKFPGLYTFERAEPCTLPYRIDYRTFKDQASFEAYITLFEDAGWKHVCGTHSSGSQYFLPMTNARQAEDIFSEPESKRIRYKKLGTHCLVYSILMVSYTILLIPEEWKLTDPFRSLYLTNGLWEMETDLFWRVFLFETPFVILRTAPLLFFVFMAVLYGTRYVQAEKYYKSNR